MPPHLAFTNWLLIPMHKFVLNKMFFSFHVLYVLTSQHSLVLSHSLSSAHSFLYHHDSSGALGIKSQVVGVFLFIDIKTCYFLFLISVSLIKQLIVLVLLFNICILKVFFSYSSCWYSQDFSHLWTQFCWLFYFIMDLSFNVLPPIKILNDTCFIYNEN